MLAEQGKHQDNHEAQRRRQTEVLTSLRSQRDAFVSDGSRGWDLFEQMASISLDQRIKSSRNKCSICWHDTSRCICDQVHTIDPSHLPRVKIIILMHHKEYMSAGNTAKLLLKMLPKAHVNFFLFGRKGDCDRLEEELRAHCRQTMTLWPGKDSMTVNDFVHSLTATSVSDGSSFKADALNESACTDPFLRAVILDGTYSNAKHMYKALKKRLGDHAPRTVALHPATVSVFHRAQKRYGAAVSESLRVSAELDSKALRVSSGEATALLLVELGGNKLAQDAITSAIKANNEALLLAHEKNQ